MELKKFADSFGPARDVLAKVDALVKEAGQHFNEAQVERAETLVSAFDEASKKAVSDAEDSLETIVHEELDASSDEDATEVDDVDERAPEDGDVYIFRGGKPIRMVPSDPKAPAVDAGASGEVVGQGSQLDPHPHPITASAIASIEAGIEAARVKDGKSGPGITTVETGVQTDKPEGGSTIELANSEGDTSTHHTDDGSRVVIDAAQTEGVKTLTADVDLQQSPIPSPEPSSAIVAAQGEAGAANQFTPSITADQPADTAAVATGAQELPIETSNTSGSEVEVPDAGVLVEHAVDLQKSSGIDGDAGVGTAAGMDADGFPVAKGSETDVSE